MPESKRMRVLLAGLLMLLLLSTLLHGVAMLPSAVTLGQRTWWLRTHPDRQVAHWVEVHEARHRAQYRREGTLSFLWRYLTSPEERLRLEAEAYAVSLCVARHQGASSADLVRLEGAIAQELLEYVPERLWSVARTRRALNSFYQEGRGCAELLPPSPPPRLLPPAETHPLPGLGRAVDLTGSGSAP